MRLSRSLSNLVSAVVMAAVMSGCTSTVYIPLVEPLPDPHIVELPVITSQKKKRIVPDGSRIVIMDISGECAVEVKDALMQRLVQNAEYDVLTRDNLEQIFGEIELTTSKDENLLAKFNSEAVSAVGELLGASYFIVGRVSYCGESSTTSPNSRYGKQYNVHATLQILDLNTGKVLLSSASRGHYLPLPASSLPQGQLPQVKTGNSGDKAAGTGEQPAESGQSAKNGFFRSAMNALKPSGRSQPAAASLDESSKKKSSKGKGNQVPESEPENYLRIKAAEAMANEFADRFFARSTWETVKMWNHPGEEFSESIRKVQLGHCPEAVDFLKNRGAEGLDFMEDGSVANYLHNYGVALLCANEPEKAIVKLQSAYRVANNQITLEMLGLAARIQEWSLHVEVDMQPEVGMLMRRDIYSKGN